MAIPFPSVCEPSCKCLIDLECNADYASIFKIIVKKSIKLSHRAPVAQQVEYRGVMREVAGLNPGRANTQGL